MNPETPQNDRARLYLQVYFDGQLEDPALRREIEQRLQSDPELRREYEALCEVRSCLKNLPQVAAPTYLRDRICGVFSEERAREEADSDIGGAAVDANEGRRGRSSTVWLRNAGWLAAACLVLAFALGTWYFRASSDQPNLDLASYVGHHIALVQNNASAIRSNDPETLESWFTERLDFRPAIPRWAGISPNAGCICNIDGSRAARIEYKSNDGEVSLFIQHPSEESIASMEAIGATSPDRALVEDVRGYRVACWASNGLEYVLVTGVSDEEFLSRLKSRA